MAKSFNSHDIKKEVVGWFSDPKLRLKNSPTSPFNLEIYEKANSQEEFKHISELVEKEWELIAADLKRDARFQEIGDELLKSSLKVIAYWQFAKIVDEDDRIASFNELGNQYVNKDKSADNAEHDEEIQQDFKVAIEQTVQSALYQAQQASIGAAFTEEIQKSIPERLLTLQDIKQVEELLFDADYLWDTYLKVRERKEHHEFIERHRKEYIEKIVEDKWSEISKIPKIQDLISNSVNGVDYKELVKLILHREASGKSWEELQEQYESANVLNLPELHRALGEQQAERSGTALEEINAAIRSHYHYERLAAGYSSLSAEGLARIQSSNDSEHFISREADEAVPFVFNEVQHYNGVDWQIPSISSTFSKGITMKEYPQDQLNNRKDALAFILHYIINWREENAGRVELEIGAMDAAKKKGRLAKKIENQEAEIEKINNAIEKIERPIKEKEKKIREIREALKKESKDAEASKNFDLMIKLAQSFAQSSEKAEEEIKKVEEEIKDLKKQRKEQKNTLKLLQTELKKQQDSLYPYKQIEEINNLLKKNQAARKNQHEMLKFQKDFMQKYFFKNSLRGEELNGNETFKQGLGPCLAYTEVGDRVIVGLNGGSNPFFVREQIDDVINAMLGTYVEYKESNTSLLLSNKEWVLKFLKKLELDLGKASGLQESSDILDYRLSKEKISGLTKDEVFLVYIAKFFRFLEEDPRGIPLLQKFLHPYDIEVGRGKLHAEMAIVEKIIAMFGGLENVSDSFFLANSKLQCQGCSTSIKVINQKEGKEIFQRGGSHHDGGGSYAVPSQTYDSLATTSEVSKSNSLENPIKVDVKKEIEEFIQKHGAYQLSSVIYQKELEGSFNDKQEDNFSKKKRDAQYKNPSPEVTPKKDADKKSKPESRKEREEKKKEEGDESGKPFDDQVKVEKKDYQTAILQSFVDLKKNIDTQKDFEAEEVIDKEKKPQEMQFCKASKTKIDKKKEKLIKIEENIDLKEIKKSVFDLKSAKALKEEGKFQGDWVKSENENEEDERATIFNPPGDGNCFYNAFAHALDNIRQSDHNNEVIDGNYMRVRAEVADYMESNINNFYNSIILEASTYISELGHLPNFFTQRFSSDAISALILGIWFFSEEFGSVSADLQTLIVRDYASTVRQTGVWAGEIEIGVVSEIYHVNVNVNGNNIGEYASAADAVNLNYAGNHYTATIQNADEAAELNGAIQTGKGLSIADINTNLAKIIEASSKQDIKISPEVIDGSEAALNIQDWLSNKETSELNTIVKIENNDESLHAVTIHAKRDGDNVSVQITDSLPQKESSFEGVLEELKAQVQSALGENSEVTIIRTGEQNEGSATCGDLSLIRISELALKNDKEYNGYTEKVTKFLSYKYDNHVFLDEKLNAQIAHANNGGMIFDSLHRAIEEGVVEEMEYGLINQCSSEDSNNEKAFNKSFYAAKKAILEAFNNQDYGLIDEILLTFDPIHRSDLLNIRYGDVGYVTGRIVRLESGSYISKAYVQQIGYNEHDVRSSDEVYSSDDQIIPLSLSFEHEGIDAVNAMRLDLDPLKFVVFDSESY